jgi:hypothetical protein
MTRKNYRPDETAVSHNGRLVRDQGQMYKHEEMTHELGHDQG